MQNVPASSAWGNCTRTPLPPNCTPGQCWPSRLSCSNTCCNTRSILRDWSLR
ncbi:hypothetical protein I6M59_13370 [Shewanella algae]|nr:hypothetical protein [Shewanella algae]NDO75912.1 hypothetical protein [Shewanella sp. SE1]NJI83969.1 hypothetical protein [Shewanella sp. Iso12]QWL03844.1 hypothetical protein JV206_06720 [Shewanella indica]MBC8795620.1 hypothetical protein [Shewanella algae]